MVRPVLHAVIRTCANVAAIMLVAFLFWLFFMAKPLEMKSVVVGEVTVLLHAKPGDKIPLTSVSDKEPWAAAFCRATEESTYFIDTNGFVKITTADPTELNYNDGSITLHPRKVTVPYGLDAGLVKVYRSVSYKCFAGIVPYTIYTNRGGWGQFILDNG